MPGLPTIPPAVHRSDVLTSNPLATRLALWTGPE